MIRNLRGKILVLGILCAPASHAMWVRAAKTTQINCPSPRYVSSAFYDTGHPYKASLLIALQDFLQTRPQLFKLFRFGPLRDEDRLLRNSQLLAIHEFEHALNTVPAYKKFIEEHEANQEISSFAEIPPMSKDNYITRAWEHPCDIYCYGKIPSGSKRDTSTGTTGKPTAWYRGPAEMAEVQAQMILAATALFNDESIFLINGFALGPWATGLTLSNAANNYDRCTTASIGPNPQQILEVIQEAIAIDAQQHIVVAGYPPHLIEVAELARAQNFHLEAYKIIAIVGGESMSESQRGRMKQSEGIIGFTEVFSSYGSSDLTINTGAETQFEQELRILLHKRPDIAKELLGETGHTATIYHYDPLNFFIETDDDGYLLFTALREKRISPRIRYKLGDKGKRKKVSDVLEILRKHGITLTHAPRTHLPLLFIWGRGDAAITYRGSNIAPENLGKALQVLGIDSIVNHYGLNQYEDENGHVVTTLMLEFITPEAAETYRASSPELRFELNRALAEVNQDFSEQLQHASIDDHPQLMIFAAGLSPMSKQRAEHPHAKKKYVFKLTPQLLHNKSSISE